MARDNDQHLTETERVSPAHTPTFGGYIARCSCGWTSAVRTMRSAAEDDGSAHHLAEIPDDMPGSDRA